MAHKATLIGLSLSLVALHAAPAAGQSGGDVLETAMQRFEQRMAGVDSYTVVQEVMGAEVTSYYEKQMVDGRPVFMEQGSWGSEEQDVGEFYHMFMTVADRAEREGTETIDGYRCHVIRVDDFSGIDLDPETADESEEFQPRLARFYLDADEYVIRKMYVEGDMQREGETYPAEIEFLFQDYREVDGMFHPFTTKMSMGGMSDAMSAEEREEARRSLEKMKQQLAEMPEAQRKMVESMMKDQMQQLEELVNSGSFEITVQVKELKVNAGPPEGS